MRGGAGEEWAGPTWPKPADEPSLPYADFLKASPPPRPLSPHACMLHAGENRAPLAPGRPPDAWYAAAEDAARGCA